MEKSEWSLFSDSQKYSLLSDKSASSSEDLNEATHQQRPSRLSRKNVVSALIAFLSVANIAFLVLNIWGYVAMREVPNFDHCKLNGFMSLLLLNFSTAPAREAIRYVPKVLDNNLFVKNAYKGNPSPELDEAWESLVDGMFTSLGSDVTYAYACRHEYSSLKGDLGQPQQNIASFARWLRRLLGELWRLSQSALLGQSLTTPAMNSS